MEPHDTGAYTSTQCTWHDFVATGKRVDKHYKVPAPPANTPYSLAHSNRAPTVLHVIIGYYRAVKYIFTHDLSRAVGTLKFST